MNPMAKKGQVSLEAVVLLLILISLFAQVTLPLTFWGSATGKATASAAMAVDSVNNLADAINLVGASGPGARKVVRFSVPINATDSAITCTEDTVSAEIETYADEGDWPDISKPVQPRLDYVSGTLSNVVYEKKVDFMIQNVDECHDKTTGMRYTGGTLYACIQNVAGKIILEIIEDSSCTWP